MSVRSLINETKNATHLLVKFHEDEQTSVIPAKRVTSPAVATLEVSATCSVRWSDHKTYKATVLAMGDDTSMREEQRKYGSDDTMNTKSRKRAANASAEPPLKKKLSTIKKSTIPKKKVSTKSKQPKNTFVLEVASPSQNDKPPTTTEANPPANTDSNPPATTGPSPPAHADSNPPATNPKVKNV